MSKGIRCSPRCCSRPPHVPAKPGQRRRPATPKRATTRHAARQPQCDYAGGTFQSVNSRKNVLDVVRSLRPTFLTDRGKSSQSNRSRGGVHASLDYNGVIPLNDLQNIPAVGVLEIRYLDVATAMNRFGGAANEGPVIVVRTH